MWLLAAGTSVLTNGNCWVVDDLAGCCFTTAGDIQQAPSEGQRFGVVEPGRVGGIDNVLEGAGGAVDAEDLVAAAVLGEARANEEVLASSAEGDAGRATGRGRWRRHR
jgi:hypothetical protein